MKYCRKCHATSPEEDVFCAVCGTRLVRLIDRLHGEREEEADKESGEKPAEKEKASMLPRLPNLSKLGYSFEKQKASAPKVNLRKLKPSTPPANMKKIAVGGVLAAVVFGFFYVVLNNSSSITSFFSSFNFTSNATASTSTAQMESKPATPKCTTVTELNETKTPYKYVFNNSILLASLNQDTKTMRIIIENKENVGGVFTAVAKFKDAGTERNRTLDKWIEANGKETFEILYDYPVGDRLTALPYANPAVETRSFSTFQNVSVQKCEQTNSTS